MAAVAREITADRLTERLPIENPDDEFGRLATAFNDTLDRLEDAFDRLKRFTADASHELRTPPSPRSRAWARSRSAPAKTARLPSTAR
jgi:signal transduction histidine kinase